MFCEGRGRDRERESEREREKEKEKERREKERERKRRKREERKREKEKEKERERSEKRKRERKREKKKREERESERERERREGEKRREGYCVQLSSVGYQDSLLRPTVPLGPTHSQSQQGVEGPVGVQQVPPPLGVVGRKWVRRVPQPHHSHHFRSWMLGRGVRVVL